MQKKSAAVYVAECEDHAGNVYVKVGLTNDILGRLPALQVGCPLEFSRVRFTYLPNREIARRAERRCHVALKKYHLRGEWFLIRAGDDAARIAVDCFSDAVSAVVKGPVKVGKLDMVTYDRTRQRYAGIFKPNINAEPPLEPAQLPGPLHVAAKP
jgi:hypothetical protein